MSVWLQKCMYGMVVAAFSIPKKGYVLRFIAFHGMNEYSLRLQSVWQNSNLSNKIIITMFSYHFQEDKPPGYTVLELEVTDADTDINGPPFKFDIVEGAPDHEFRVDSNGVLSTAARFDRDIKDVYDLVIRVYDNGSPSLYSETTVSK